MCQLPGWAAEATGPARFAFTSVYVRPKAIRQFTFGPDQVVSVLRRDQSLLLRRVLDATTLEEFVASRLDVSRSYCLMSESIRTAVSAKFSSGDWAQLARASVQSLLFDVEKGAQRIGPNAVDDALFSISTLGRIPRLLIRLITDSKTSSTTPEKAYTDLLAEFIADTLVCELHLHLLVLMLRDQSVHIRPFALSETLRGLSVSVDMYAAARRAASLVRPADDTLEEPFVLNDEDRELLDSSDDDFSARLHTS
jgi:hypothetical protein